MSNRLTPRSLTRHDLDGEPVHESCWRWAEWDMLAVGVVWGFCLGAVVGVWVMAR